MDNMEDAIKSGKVTIGFKLKGQGVITFAGQREFIQICFRCNNRKQFTDLTKKVADVLFAEGDIDDALVENV